LAATEVLEVPEDPVGVRLAEIAAEALCVVGDLLGRLGRALVALLTQARLSLLGAALQLLLCVLCLLLHLLLGALGRRA
jgi:hypothetical protein